MYSCTMSVPDPGGGGGAGGKPPPHEAVSFLKKKKIHALYDIASIGVVWWRSGVFWGRLGCFNGPHDGYANS